MYTKIFKNSNMHFGEAVLKKKFNHVVKSGLIARFFVSMLLSYFYNTKYWIEYINQGYLVLVSRFSWRTCQKSLIYE